MYSSSKNVPKRNRQESTIETTQSTYGLTNTISDSESLQAAVQNVMKAEMNKSRRTS